MGRPDATQFLAEIAELAASVSRLETFVREIDLSLADFAHQARRQRDVLERLGGRSRDAEAALRQLTENIALSRREQEAAKKRLTKLRERIAALRQKPPP